MAWTLVNKDVSTCLMGVSRVEHMHSNLKALEVAQNWTPEKEAKMAEILDNNPLPALEWFEWKPLRPRREIATQ